MGVKEFTSFMFVPISVIILMGVVVYFVSLGFVIQHENVHKAIYDNYGIDSEVHINYLTMSGYTITYDGDKCTGDCEMLHSYNEIVSYNVDSIMFGIYGVGFIFLLVTLFIYLEFRAYNRNILKILEKNG
jgi:hypothetical protein